MLLLIEHLTAIAPAAGRRLTGDEAIGENLDDLVDPLLLRHRLQEIRLGPAQPIQEENSESDVVGVPILGSGLADKGFGLLNDRMARGEPALHERQAWQGCVTKAMRLIRCRPGAVDALHAPEVNHAAEDGVVGLGLLRRRQGRRLGSRR